MEKIDLKALSETELHAFFENNRLPPYRTRQLIHWLYRKMASSIQDMTEFSKDLRERLSSIAYISNLNLIERQVSSDGTEKFLFGLEDGEKIESVLIPDKDRLTLCISSQVGCAMGCRFCLTGAIGFKRNLKAHEIVDQVLSVQRDIGQRRISNIVFMGMGEPLLNFDETIEAIKRLTGLLGFSKRKITVSTSGVVPMIDELARSGCDVNLAVSLNATTDSIREGIMPVNKRWPIEALLEACRRYPLSPRRRITFEYVMLGGINDRDEDAERLVRLLKTIRSKVNLIPFNPFYGSIFKRPADERVLRFQEILLKGNITALIRKSKGEDISAACGQLKAKYL